ncbi:nuclear localization sequence-binding protein (p67) [Rothia dentocariosa]|uniref:nuclear localization sequence-binding protein (p67) n=1 Tax=Rothia dentocariosa TaxID=2047 RepID=UPI002448A4B6|nr:nuclear localization sequence-binding protein (p67) [Rothia dentocariosa]
MSQPPAPQYPVPAPKKKPIWPWFLGGGCLIILLIFAGCSALVFAGAKSASDSISSASAHADEDIKVELVATSTGKGHVTYGPSLSSSSSSADFENEWKQEAETKRKDGYSLDVSSFDEGVEVTCKIIVNGEVKDEQKATGDGYSSAHCNLSADFGYGDK